MVPVPEPNGTKPTTVLLLFSITKHCGISAQNLPGKTKWNKVRHCNYLVSHMCINVYIYLYKCTPCFIWGYSWGLQLQEWLTEVTLKVKNPPHSHVFELWEEGWAATENEPRGHSETWPPNPQRPGQASELHMTRQLSWNMSSFFYLFIYLVLKSLRHCGTAAVWTYLSPVP